MSNLSELLPAGGGGKNVDFVASGTIGNGVTVGLNSDGTVSEVFTNSQTESLGPQTAFSSSNVDYPAIAYGVDDDKFVAFFTTSSGVKASVITRSNTSLSAGSEVTIATTGDRGTVRYDSNSGNFVFTYRGTSSYPTVRVGSINGTSLTLGTAVVVASEDSGSNTTVSMGASGKGAVVYGFDYKNGKGVGITVSGTTATIGGTVTFDTQSVGNIQNFIGAPDYDSGTGRVVFSYQQYNGSTGVYTIRAISADISGTTPSFGSIATVLSSSSNPSSPNIIYDSDQGRFIIGYVPNGDSPFLKAATVSGSSISIGGGYDVDTADVANSGAVVGMAYDSTAKVTVLSWYRNNITPTIMYGLVSLSGTTFTKISTSTLSSSSNSWSPSQFFTASDNTGFAVFNYKYSSKSYGQVLRIPYNNTNLTDFIGISDAAISDTASGSVTIKGGISTNVTGLTPNATYYVQADGTLSTTTSTVLAGKALSSTSINLDYTT